jgi:hypothetical protein
MKPDRERNKLMIVWLLGYGAPWPTVVSPSSPSMRKLTIQGEIDIIVSCLH